MTQAVSRSQVPLSKKQILAAAGVTDAWWNDARTEFERLPNFVQLGDRRTAVYTTMERISDAVVKMVRAAGKQGILAADAKPSLRGAEFDLDPATWKTVMSELLAARRITKSGQTNGTRYFA